jgi:hypothetical protein
MEANCGHSLLLLVTLLLWNNLEKVLLRLRYFGMVMHASNFCTPYRFRVEHWFQFPSELELCSPGVDDDNKEMMVEGLLTLILTLLSCRLHCG